MICDAFWFARKIDPVPDMKASQRASEKVLSFGQWLRCSARKHSNLFRRRVIPTRVPITEQDSTRYQIEEPINQGSISLEAAVGYAAIERAQ